MEPLYQKYNPKTLEDVVGHTVTVKELKKRAKDNNFSNVMIFSGESGLGKTVLSRIIAKYILCPNKDERGNFCGTCPTCLGISQQKEVETFKEINCSNVGIDEMRSIVDASTKRIAFSTSSKKVFYLDELQELSTRSRAAEKNLLKILEKPNPNTYWILGTMDLSKISKAIINRATPYKLNNLKADDILQRMIYICEQEGIKLETADQANVLTTIAYNCSFSMRTAISLLERVIYSDLWTEEKVYEELDLLSDEKIMYIANDILEGSMQFFNQRISRDQIENIYKLLFIAYKKSLGIEIQPYEQSKIKGLKSTDVSKIEKTLENLETIFENKYVTDTTVMIHLLKTAKGNKEELKDNWSSTNAGESSSNSGQPVRRRRV